MNWRVKLQIAAMTGDWDTAKTYDRSKLESAITDKDETALHIAAAAKQVKFTENLVNRIKQSRDHPTVRNYLELKNVNNNTALCYAASTGIKRIAELMVDAHRGDEVGNNNHLLPSLGDFKPLQMAACCGHREMVTYLYDITNITDWSVEDRFELFTSFIAIDMCEEALHMLSNDDKLGKVRNEDGDTALRVLARRPTAFVRECQPCHWRRILGFFKKLMQGTKSRDDKSNQPYAIALVEKLYAISITNGLMEHPDNPNAEIAQALMIGAESGNDKFVIALIRLDPNLTWKVHEKKGSIFHIAIRNRYQSIFNLCYELGSVKNMVAQDTVSGEENMLHLAAKLAPQPQLNAVSGAALQMQLELVWYKEVEKMIPPSYVYMANAEGKTPLEVFTEEHKELMHKGEKWMKETAKSSMLVAALIATVMFTTAFTVPGGYNNSSGEPVFDHHGCFLIFFAADALGLFCSSTSILMFHSIITSRYENIDFLETLPSRLMVGITALFVSVAAMMVAFSATFPLYYPHHDLAWSFALFGVFACVPSLYVSLKYPLLVDLIRSTYDSHFMFRSQKQLFCGKI